MVEEELRQRRFEPVVRLEVQPDADPAMVAELVERFALAPDDVYEMSALLDYTTLFEIAGLDDRRAARPALDAAGPDECCEAAPDSDIFSAIRSRRHPAAPPLRQLLRERRAVHPRGGRRSADAVRSR